MPGSRTPRRAMVTRWPLWALLPVAATGCGTIDGLQPVTPRGEWVISLFALELALAFVICTGVAAAAFYAMYRFRDRPGAPEPPQIHGNTRLEIAWTLAPIALLMVLFYLMIRTMAVVEEDAASPLRVRVIGNQWWWDLEYPDLGVVTSYELHIPAGQPVRLELMSDDVVHSFWIPQFGWKKDNTPNHVTTMTVVADRPGVYNGVCGEFCGTQHAWMRVIAVVETPEEFAAWVARQQQPAPVASPRGLEVFREHTCINCHAIRGVGTARVGPDLTSFGLRADIGSGVITNTPENLAAWIVDPQRIKPGALMPGYPGMPREDLLALVDYLEGLK